MNVINDAERRYANRHIDCHGVSKRSYGLRENKIQALYACFEELINTTNIADNDYDELTIAVKIDKRDCEYQLSGDAKKFNHYVEMRIK